jgi:hypothetical protein
VGGAGEPSAASATPLPRWSLQPAGRRARAGSLVTAPRRARGCCGGGDRGEHRGNLAEAGLVRAGPLTVSCDTVVIATDG